MIDTEITPAVAAGVLWHFGDTQGRDPGSFVMHLLDAMSAADLSNRAALVAAFPEIGRAFLLMKSARDGREQLRAIAAERTDAVRIEINVNRAPVALGILLDPRGRYA